MDDRDLGKAAVAEFLGPFTLVTAGGGAVIATQNLGDGGNRFAPAAVSTVVLGFVFAVLLLWGVWAMRTAYVGWAEHHLTQRQFLGVIVRFVAMYLVLGFFLLS